MILLMLGLKLPDCGHRSLVGKSSLILASSICRYCRSKKSWHSHSRLSICLLVSSRPKDPKETKNRKWNIGTVSPLFLLRLYTCVCGCICVRTCPEPCPLRKLLDGGIVRWLVNVQTSVSRFNTKLFFQGRRHHCARVPMAYPVCGMCPKPCLKSRLHTYLSRCLLVITAGHCCKGPYQAAEAGGCRPALRRLHRTLL